MEKDDAQQQPPVVRKWSRAMPRLPPLPVGESSVTAEIDGPETASGRLQRSSSSSEHYDTFIRAIEAKLGKSASAPTTPIKGLRIRSASELTDWSLESAAVEKILSVGKQ